MPQVTEKWLGEIGGWQAMKTAREFVRLAAVSEVSAEGNVYRGLVGSGKQKYRATLVAGEGSRAEAKCGCPDARRGLICAHALAVALAAITKPEVVPGAARQADIVSASPPSPASEGQGQGSGADRGIQSAPAPAVSDAAIPPGQFTIFIATDSLGSPPPLKAASPPTIPVFLKFEPGGESRDAAVARWLLDQGLPVRTAPLRLPAGELGNLLTVLANHPRVFAGVPSAAKDTEKSPKEPRKLLVLSNLRLQTSSQLYITTQSVVLESTSNDCIPIESGNSPWFWSVSQSSFAPLPEDLPPAVLGFLATLMRHGKATQPLRWVVENLAALCQVIDPASDDDLIRRLRVVPAQPLFRLRLDGNFRRVEGRLGPLLPDGETDATPESYPFPDPQNPLLFYTRNLAAERAAQWRLEDTGFRKAETSSRQTASFSGATVELKGEREILRFLSSDLPRLRRDFQIVEGEGWRHATRGLAIIRPKVRPPGKEREPQPASAAAADWLSLEVAYEATDGFSIPRNEVLRLIRSGKRDVSGRDGRRYLLDAEGCEELEDMVQDMESHFESGNRLAVRARQAEVLGGFIDRPDVLALHLVAPLDPAALKAKLGGLGECLRPYQCEGIRWMERHSRTRGGGILADEMGLGKTVQTLALLRLLKQSCSCSSSSSSSFDTPALQHSNTPSPASSPALVICPTSLLNNWAEEAARFTPELRTHVSHDSDRHESFEKLANFDVIFTSYALIVRDLEFYKPLTFSTIVLDEASYIRNPDTATARAVRQLRAACRFALTGTPVENSVRDLWSIFEFLVPRQLPERDDFHERFVKPLAQTDSAQARPVMERLRRLIRPNLLRRTKREVAKDLPEKIEKVLWCDLSAPQREVYRRLLDEGREEIRQARRRSGQGSARMTMFTVLLRLRQVCNDLRLVGIPEIDKLPAAETSGKWPVLEELLEETLDGGHKALIFSQFVSMLRLIREKVHGQGTPHSYLDGSTQNRAGEVAAFQTDPARRLFLISLKAGGYGLNLTAADEVVLIDPWWNPAVEAQAIDRAHRIGQGRPVTAYRLVTRGTVEEKILKLQAQKRAVMDMTLEDDATVLSGVTDAELEAMLA